MQKCLLGSFETCLEAVSDFTELVNTLPEHISCERTQHEALPIIACEDRSIATAALSILKVSVYVFVYICTYEAILCFSIQQAQVPRLQEMHKKFLIYEKKRTCHHHYFVTK